MSILLVGGIIAAVAYFATLGNVAAAAKDLLVNFRKAQIYKFVQGGSIVIRCFVDFTNLHSNAIILQNVKLDVVLDNITVGFVNVGNIRINPGTEQKYFDLEMPWANLGAAAIIKVLAWFQSGTLTPPQKCTIKGQIKTEGFLLKVDKVIPFTTV